jgi:hypothetical protein
VEADLSGMMWTRRCFESEEERAKELERAVKDFEEFLRDHRSQDMVTLFVDRVYADVCSECDEEWELDTHPETGKPICAWCGVEIKESNQC